MISITFQFDDDSDSAHALMAMNEILGTKDSLSPSSLEQIGFIADMLLECADMMIVWGDEHKNRYAARSFRKLADTLDERLGAIENAGKAPNGANTDDK